MNPRRNTSAILEKTPRVFFTILKLKFNYMKQKSPIMELNLSLLSKYPGYYIHRFHSVNTKFKCVSPVLNEFTNLKRCK